MRITVVFVFALLMGAVGFVAGAVTAVGLHWGSPASSPTREVLSKSGNPQVEQTAARQRVHNDLKAIALQWMAYEDKHERPPASVDDLTSESIEDEAAFSRLKEGRYIFRWGQSRGDDRDKWHRLILGYESSATKGNHAAVMADAQTTELSESNLLDKLRKH